VDFEELLRRVDARVRRYDGPADAAVVLGAAVEAEADALWGAAQPADPGRVSGVEEERRAAASLVLGWLAYCRHTALGPGLPAVVELARAVLRLSPIASAGATVPAGLRSMIGAGADAEVQADTGTRLLLATGHTDDRGVLQAAVVLLGSALGRLPAEHPEWARFTANFGLASLRLYESQGSVEDLDLAAEAIEAAVAADEEHPDRPGWLSNLARVHQARYGLTGDTAELHRQVDVLGQALAGGHFDEPGVLGMLGAAYRNLYWRNRESADLDRAVDSHERAVASTPDGVPRVAEQWAALGVVRLERWEHTGVEADLDRGIEVLGVAVAAAPAGHPDRPGWLSGLGVAHRKRYRLTGVPADLDRAVELLEGAVAALPPGRRERPGLLSTLGSAYRARFDRAGAVADLDRGVRCLAAASAETPPSGGGQPVLLADLAALHASRFGHSGQESDAAAAIRLLHLAASAEEHPARPVFLRDLAAQYESRYARSGSAADLDRAIALLRQVLAVVPVGHGGRAPVLARLGRAYLRALEAGDHSVTPVLLRDLAEGARAAGTGTPADRVRAHRAVGELAYAMGDHEVAVRSLGAAVALLPSVAPGGGGPQDRERLLGEHAGLVSEAVAAHCEVGDAAGAVEVAEHGRGVLLATRLGGRTESAELERAHPEVAERFHRLRDDLGFAESADQVEGRGQLWMRYEGLLAEIRRLDGFGRFLLPPGLAELRPAGGVVVLVNAGSRRCDAVLVGAVGEPVVVRLPDLTRAEVAVRAAELLDAHGPGRQAVIGAHLAWLWTAVVGPVLGALPEGVSRVWWLPTGLLGLLPLHAAGPPGEPGALERVVSSYTPTLRALVDARTRPTATVREQVVVALSHTPGLPDLPDADPHPDAPHLLDRDATAERVLAALSGATWAHLACHAVCDPEVPARSGLHLADGPLPVAGLTGLRPDAELAYLAACSTAPGGQADESVHLASAVALAGFRHVVAGLWHLNDQVATYVARAFHHHLPDGPTADGAAEALHAVTRTLRGKYPNRPELWAALVHSGP